MTEKIAKAPAKKATPMSFMSALTAQGRTEIQIDVNLIDPDPKQPRRTWHSPDGIVPQEEIEKLNNLAADIEQNDLIQAISVREQGNGRYQIVVGERRWRAHVKLGRATILCVVRNDLEARNVKLFQLAENVQNSKMSDYDTAMFVKALMEEYPDLQKKDLAAMLNQQPSYISRMMAFIDDRWSHVVDTGVIRYASVLEMFKALPQESQASLVAKSKTAEKPISAQDVQAARKAAKGGAANTGADPASSGSGWKTGDSLQPDALRDSIESVMARNRVEGESYKGPSPTLIRDTGAQISVGLPKDGEHVRRPDVMPAHRVDMTLGQLSALMDTVALDEKESVSVKLDLDLMQKCIQSLGGVVPEEAERTAAVLLELLGKVGRAQ